MIGEQTSLPHAAGCACCGRASRREFLAAAATAFAATTVVDAVGGPARADTRPTPASPIQTAQAPAQGRPILLKGGIVLTMDRAIGDFESADVLIDGGKIRAVQPNISAPDAEVVDAANTIVMPGFVDTGGSISIAPYVEMIMGHGTPVLQATLDRGLRPSLSVDVETTVPGDRFTMMRSALSIQRELVFQRMRANEQNVPKLLTARDVLEFATIEGAKANGLGKKCGSLTPGKDADVIVLRTDSFNVMPVNNASGAVVQSMDTSNVDTVFVAGKEVKRGGKMVGVDQASVLRLASEARDRVLARAKLERKRV
jgi:cytosine/adenosine deaminase-related metal-dependent hydrolase